jgi:hypothetical protein
MADEERLVHAKDRVPIEEGVVIPKEDLDLVNDDSPTENVDPVTHEGEVLDKRPTDGPL